MKEYTSSKEELLQEVYSLRQKIQEDESTISELRSNAKFLQSIFNSIQDGISVIDSSLNVIYANHVIKTRHPDMIPIEGKKCYYAYHKRDIPCESCPSKKAFETGTFQRDEFSTLTPEGKIVWRERNVHPVKEAEGEVKRVVEHVCDITEHLKIKQELEKFKFILDNTIEECYLIRPNGQIEYVNEAVAKSLGYNVQEMIGLSVQDIDQKFANKEYAYHFKKLQEKGAMSFESYQTTVDGKELIKEIRSTHLTIGDREFVCGFGRDITDKKRIEAALQASEQNYREIFDNAGDGILIHDTGSLDILDVNQAMCEMFGYTYNELLDLTVDDIDGALNSESKSVKERFKRTLSQGPQYFEWLAKKRDGSTFWVEVTLKKARIGGEEKILAIVRDITSKKQTQEERKQLNNELLDKNKELEQVLYVTTHDLRSPLVNVLGFSKELLASLQEMQSILNRVDLPQDNKDQLVPLLNDDIPESIEYILNGISKMDALISGLLRLSRIGRSETRKTEIDMNEMIKSVVMAFDHQLKESQTRVTVDPLPSCYGDESQVNQVFSNLLDNAIKYAHPDRYLVIHIQGSRQESYCLYSIEDNGLGISPEYKDKIFDIFYRLNPVSSQGEGLGLTVIQKILYKHSGKIWVESQPGQGSKFCVSLPASCQ